MPKIVPQLFLGALLLLLAGAGSPVSAQKTPPPPVPENGVAFDVPAQGQKNPDSPAAGSISAKGKVVTAPGWTCTGVEVTITELPALMNKDTKSYVPSNNTWSYLGNNIATSGTTCNVSVEGTFKETATGNTEKKLVSQTVSVK